jgi:simple sugar transport system substrate-binding protein
MSVFQRAFVALLLLACTAAGAAEPFKVGFVYVGPVGESGWSFAHDVGRKAIEQKFGAKVKTSFVESVQEGADAERVIRSLSQQDHKVIFTTSFGYMNQTLKVAKSYPKVVYQHATGYKTADNVGVYDIRTYEGAYLSGVVAGKTSKSAKLGVVASIPIPEVIRNINAFTLGARSVNPNISTRVVWVNKWYDPGKEREAALAMIAQGVDVLLQNTDSPAVVQTAQDKGVYAFGWDSDMSKYGARAHLAASVLNWGIYYTKVVDDVMNNRWKTGAPWWGLKEGAIDLTNFSKDVPADVVKLVDERRQGIISNKRPVFAGPLKDQAGKIRIPGGKAMTDAEMLAMDWYVEGVEGVLPK